MLRAISKIQKRVGVPYTVRNGHAIKFSSELIHIILLKIQKIINIS
jgi:hypothetical protein